MNAVHPGIVATNLGDNMASGETWTATLIRWMRPVFENVLAVTPEFGSLTQVYVATHPDIVDKKWKGEYFVPTAQWQAPSAYAQDAALATKFWSFTESVLKEKGY